MLMEMFGDYQRPFYQSAEILNLGKINRKVYAEFINFHFGKRGRTLESEAMDLILNLCEIHTFYVQFLCNKIFGSNIRKITPELVIKTMIHILKEQEVIYVNYRNLLTKHQFDLVKAIAVEQRVNKPTSKNFIKKHDLSAASTIKTSLNSLLTKEMIYKDEEGYKVYDVFFAQWLRRY